MSDATTRSPQQAAPAGAFISLSGIVKDYGSIRALNHVDFWVNPAEIVGLVGDNEREEHAHQDHLGRSSAHRGDNHRRREADPL